MTSLCVALGHQALIDDEIRKFRNIKADKQKELLRALNQAPSEVLNPLSPTAEIPVSLPYEEHFPSYRVCSK